jgi:hypothetical protein
MIAVFVSDQDSLDRAWIDSYFTQPLLCLLSREPTVYKEPHPCSFNKGAVGFTTRRES